jgi:hypothetical protein
MPPKKKIVFLFLAIKIGLTTMCLCGCGILPKKTFGGGWS